MANLRAIDVDILPETFTIALSDVLVVETDLGTRGVIVQVLIDELVVEYFASPAPTTPPPTTPPPPTIAPTTPAPTTTTPPPDTTTPAPTTTPSPTTPAATTPAPTTPAPTTPPPPAFTLTSWSSVGIAVVGSSNYTMGCVLGGASGTVSTSSTFSPAWGSGGSVIWTVNGSTDHTDTVGAGAGSYSGSVAAPANATVTIAWQPDGTGGDVIIITADSSCTSNLINASVRAWTSASNGCSFIAQNPINGSTSHYRVFDTSFSEEVFSSGNTSAYTTSFTGPWGTISNVGGTTQTNNGSSVTVYGDFTGSFPGPDRYTLLDVQ